jgi:hypothetical protein
VVFARHKFAPYLAPISSVRGRSPRFAAVRESAPCALTRQDEQRRTAVDGRSSFAKVGVAGSNPVVRSRERAGQRADSPTPETPPDVQVPLRSRFGPASVPHTFPTGKEPPAPQGRPLMSRENGYTGG